jgi:hypothetical protein
MRGLHLGRPTARHPAGELKAVLLRFGILGFLLLLVALTTLRYRRTRAGLHDDRWDDPPVPAALLDGADRTWLLFTTPYCASCGPVEARLRAADPSARLVRVDATREPMLADAFGIRAAPTVLLADAGGRVEARLVGAAAVDRYVTAIQA